MKIRPVFLFDGFIERSFTVSLDSKGADQFDGRLAEKGEWNRPESEKKPSIVSR